MTTSALRSHRVLLIVIGGVLAVLAAMSAWMAIDEALLPAAEPADPKPAVDGVSSLTVLTINVWHGGTQISDGSQAIADIILETDADVTFMPEVGRAPARAGKLLGYEHYIATDTGIVS